MKGFCPYCGTPLSYDGFPDIIYYCHKCGYQHVEKQGDK